MTATPTPAQAEQRLRDLEAEELELRRLPVDALRARLREIEAESRELARIVVGERFEAREELRRALDKYPDARDAAVRALENAGDAIERARETRRRLDAAVARAEKAGVPLPDAIPERVAVKERRDDDLRGRLQRVREVLAAATTF